MAIKERKQITGTEAQIKGYAGHNGVLAYATDTKHLHVLSGTAGTTTELANRTDIPDVTGKADTTYVNAELAKKQPTGDYATTSALTSGLAGKANSSHTHTKSQITDFPTIPDTSTLIPKAGARGNLAGYESVKASTASTVIDVSSADAMTISGVEAGATITITATVKNVSSTKVVRVTGDNSWQITGSGSPTNGVTLKWAGDTAPTIKANMLLVINYTGNGNEVFCNAIAMG